MAELRVRDGCLDGFFLIQTNRPDAQGTASHQRSIRFECKVVRLRIAGHVPVDCARHRRAAIHCHLSRIPNIKGRARKPAQVVAGDALYWIVVRIDESSGQCQGQFAIVSDLAGRDAKYTASRQGESVVDLAGEGFAPEKLQVRADRDSYQTGAIQSAKQATLGMRLRRALCCHGRFFHFKRLPAQIPQ